jgi:hypothetical protein
VVASAASMFRGVVKVVALLGFVQRGLCCSSAVRAMVDQAAAAVEDKDFFGQDYVFVYVI